MIVFGQNEEGYPYQTPGHVARKDAYEKWYYLTDEEVKQLNKRFKKKFGILAKYECMDKDCKHRWETFSAYLNCFKCGYIFVRWLNSEKCLKAIYKDDPTFESTREALRGSS